MVSFLISKRKRGKRFHSLSARFFGIRACGVVASMKESKTDGYVISARDLAGSGQYFIGAKALFVRSLGEAQIFGSDDEAQVQVDQMVGAGGFVFEVLPMNTVMVSRA